MEIIDRIVNGLKLYEEVDLDEEAAAEAEKAKAKEKAAAEKPKSSLFRTKIFTGGKAKTADVQDDEIVAEQDAAQEEKPKKSFFGGFGKKAEPAAKPVEEKAGSRTINLPIANKLINVVVIEPASFDDSPKIADYLRKGQPVVVNFDKTDSVLATRMTDFISGTIYAVNGSIRKLSRTILICAPKNVDIDADNEEIDEKGGQLWKK